MSNRKVATAKTAVTGILFNVVTAILGFVTQKLFIENLGIENSGINGVFTSVVSILTMADLGVSTAIMFNLYGPLAEGNQGKVAALMAYYRKACWVICGIIAVGGLIMVPFAPMFVGDVVSPVNLYVLFCLFVLNALMTYAFNYKRPLLLADQKGYVVNRVTLFTSILLYGLKIAVLVFTKNFYLLMLGMILVKLIENCIIGCVVNKRYSYLAKKKKVSQATRKDIKRRIYASAYHNAGAYVVYSTDNIVLSKACGTVQAGLYSSYYMIINTVLTLINQVFNAMTASLGNIYAKDGKEALYRATKNSIFLNFWIYSVVGVSLYFCITPFIRMWIGDDYLFADFTVLALCFNFFLQGLRGPVGNVLGAAGIVYENRFIPIIESIINLVSSILLALWIGVPGVFIGTIISNLFLHLYGYSKYGFEKVLGRKRSEYCFILVKEILLYWAIFALMYVITSWIRIDSLILQFIAYGIVCIVLPSLMFFVLFRKKQEFKYIKKALKTVLKR